MRVAVLEDDLPLCRQLEQIVTDSDHFCHTFASSRALITSLRRDSYDLLLLDWNLPDMSGLELLDWAQANLSPCPPVIMVTSRTDDADVVVALQAGADDYVIKPFEPRVLVARIEALLRRSYAEEKPAVGVEEHCGVAFDHAASTVHILGEEILLTAKEFGLALTLFRNVHRAMSRMHLLEAVWGRNPELPTRTLDVHISRLRTRLRLRPERGFRLTPVYSYGYRLEIVDQQPKVEGQ